MYCENRGLEYEKNCRVVVKKVAKKFPDLLVMNSAGGGSFSAHDTDLAIKIGSVRYNIEIKADARAQMGGISIAYVDGALIVPDDKFDEETYELVEAAIKNKTDDVTAALEWFKKNDPIFKYNKSPQFPLKVSTEAWNKAIDLGIVKALNSNIEQTAEFICRHYKNKNINYIQIGGAGLFYLSSNPLKLPIPKLQGEIHIEFRAGKSGVKKNATGGYEYSTVILRMQGRLKFRGESDYSLDDENSATELFSKIIAPAKNESNVWVPAPSQTLGVARINMPQLRADDVNEFISDLERANIRVMNKTVDPKTLKATQKDFNVDKIEAMMNKIRNSDVAIIVSKDNYVMDGHHRWLSYIALDKPIKITQISLPVKVLFNKMKSYKHTFTKAIGEMKLEYAETDLTISDIKMVEKFANALFDKVGIDVAFTRHFLDRVNDTRNGTPITVKELIRLFNGAYIKFGQKIQALNMDQEAVLNDPKTYINLPFIIQFDRRTKNFTMVAKTVMRKNGFKSPDPIMKIDSRRKAVLEAKRILRAAGMRIEKLVKNESNVNWKEVKPGKWTATSGEYTLVAMKNDGKYAWATKLNDAFVGSGYLPVVYKTSDNKSQVDNAKLAYVRGEAERKIT